MALQIKKAQRSMAKLKFGIAGSSGSGKTLSSLLLGFGLVKSAHPNLSDDEVWEKICVIDTENESASLYADSQFGTAKVGSYLTIPMGPPFTPQRYMEAIDVAEGAGVEYLIIDSLSHAWSGEGGMLDVQNRAAIKSGNSYTAWREVTPLHNRLVDKLLQCDMHIAVTMRTKTEYVIEENERGKKTPRKIGTAPVFRDGIEYEFTIFFEVGQDHYATASKDRTGLFDGRSFVIDPSVGSEVWGWLSGAKPAEQKLEARKPEPKPEPTPAPKSESKRKAKEPVPPEDDYPTDLPWEGQNEPVTPEPKPTSISQSELEAYAEKVLDSLTDDELGDIAAEIKAVNNGKSNYRNIGDSVIRNAVYDIFRQYDNKLK